MNQRLAQVLAGHHGNYILPFLWMHGEDEAVLRTEVARMHEAGIGALCVESRPHPDFCGPRWWHDMDIVMDEARRRGMRVWVLDDAHFPTGFANGWIRDRYPEHKKVYLAERHVDVLGPAKGAAILSSQCVNAGAGDKVVAVVAARRAGFHDSLDGSVRHRGGGSEPGGVGDVGPDSGPLDLTASLQGDLVLWDIPSGHWRVFFIVETPSGGGDPSYLNPIDHESCRVLIDAVYEPHYARYGADFGVTFAGFFSDEPNIGNAFGYNKSIGRSPMALPWRRVAGPSSTTEGGMLSTLSAELGYGAAHMLPALWYDMGGAPGLFAMPT